MSNQTHTAAELAAMQIKTIEEQIAAAKDLRDAGIKNAKDGYKNSVASLKKELTQLKKIAGVKS